MYESIAPAFRAPPVGRPASVAYEPYRALPSIGNDLLLGVNVDNREVNEIRSLKGFEYTRPLGHFDEFGIYIPK